MHLHFTRHGEVALQAALFPGDALDQAGVLDGNRDLRAQGSDGAAMIVGEVTTPRVF